MTCEVLYFMVQFRYYTKGVLYMTRKVLMVQIRYYVRGHITYDGGSVYCSDYYTKGGILNQKPCPHGGRAGLSIYINICRVRLKKYIKLYVV